MTRLEDLQPTAAVRGILPEQLVTVVSVQWFGSAALELTYKGPSGRVANELLYRQDEPRLEVVELGRRWSFDGDGHLFRLVSEAHRIRLGPTAPRRGLRPPPGQYTRRNPIGITARSFSILRGSGAMPAG
jgi:hypothetical protein